jgi:hypothetical protein
VTFFNLREHPEASIPNFLKLSSALFISYSSINPKKVIPPRETNVSTGFVEQKNLPHDTLSSVHFDWLADSDSENDAKVQSDR